MTDQKNDPAEEAPACKTCGGKGYTEHEGGEGEGYPSRPEIEACLCREEAPAEAGERDYPAEFEAWWSTYRHRNRDVADYPVKKQIAFEAFYFGARAQPQSREGEAVAWVGSEELDLIRCGYQTVTATLWREKISGTEPLYVHPAPDALRVAVSDAMVEAACSRFVSESDDIWSASAWPEGPDDDGDRGDGGRVRLISEADQHNIRAAMRFAMTDALAALQAEQKGGA